MRRHVECYGTDYVKPKHHWACDLAQQFRLDACVLDAFVIERQHLLVKSIAEHVKNTSIYEASVLSGVLNVQAQHASSFRFGGGLEGVKRNLAEAPGVVVSDKVVVHSFVVSARDVVFRGPQAATVVVCADDGSDLFLLVSPMAEVVQVTSHASKFRAPAGLVVWRASDVQQALAWRDEPNCMVLVIRQ